MSGVRLSRCCVVRNVQGVVEAVPVARYFAWVGGALLALLLIAGWVWPSAAPEPSPVDEASAQTSQTSKTILRIHSARKWPDKVEFNTSIPTIIPPPPPAEASAPIVAENPPALQPLDARAEMKPSAPPPKRQARVHRRNPRAATSTWATANPAPQPWGWSNSPHWSWNW